MKPDLLTAAKAARDALWDCTTKLESQLFRNPVQLPNNYREIVDNGFAAHRELDAAIEEAERAEPVAWIDGGDLRGVFNGNSVWVHAEDQGRMIPLYLHPAAPTVPDGRWDAIETLMILGNVEMQQDDGGGYTVSLEPAESNMRQDDDDYWDKIVLERNLSAMSQEQRRNNPRGEPMGHFTGRCGRCGSNNLWDDNLHYGCNACGALLA